MFFELGLILLFFFNKLAEGFTCGKLKNARGRDVF